MYEFTWLFVIVVKEAYHGHKDIVGMCVLYFFPVPFHGLRVNPAKIN
jgi:hypothetical protein